MCDIQGRSSVAGVAGVAAATGIVEATLGAAISLFIKRETSSAQVWKLKSILQESSLANHVKTHEILFMNDFFFKSTPVYFLFLR